MDNELHEIPKRPNKRIKEAILTICGVVLATGILLLICYLMYVFDIEPLKRSFLGTRFFLDPEGLSIYERICAIFGWV